MWSQIEKSLSTMLASKVFPALKGVASYDALLNAGRPDPARCAAFAQTVISKTDLTSGIRELSKRAPAKVQEWSKPLYRAVSPASRRDGRWWFDEELVKRWERRYPVGTPNRKQMIMESIRPMLAVCFDWNDFLDLVVWNPASAIPVVTGQGAHKPIHSATDPNGRYDKQEKVVFIGGYTQVFVPLVNPSSIKNYVL